MKISKVGRNGLAEYLRLPQGSFSNAELDSVMDAALGYIEAYTGIPLYPAEGEKGLNDYEDLTLAYLILCQDLYDNRTAYADTDAANRTLEGILGLHRRNLV